MFQSDIASVIRRRCRFYSNKLHGLRKKKADSEDEGPALIDSDISRRAFRKNWARLIQKVYNVDPLLTIDSALVIGMVIVAV